MAWMHLFGAPGVLAVGRPEVAEPERPGYLSRSRSTLSFKLRSLSLVQYAMANMADIKNSVRHCSFLSAQPPDHTTAIPTTLTAPARCLRPWCA